MVNFHAGSAVMGPWDTMTVQDENAEEEIDMFAVLGAAPPSQHAPNAIHQQPPLSANYDPLAAFMEDDEEETLIADSMFGRDEEPAGISGQMSEAASQPLQQSLSAPVVQPILSNEVITELLEVLVKKELHARAERGEDWLSDLPAQARAEIESAKVIKEQEAYHLSLIIDMVGTGQVRPFATVLSTGDGPLPVNPPSHLGKSWYPLYNALRELLLQAMSSLSHINVVSGKSTSQTS